VSAAAVLQFPAASDPTARYIADAREARDGRARIMAKAPAGAKAVIVAELEEDQSEPQTDYFGSKTVRRVAIGFRMTPARRSK
jgi:hypothetical protein